MTGPSWKPLTEDSAGAVEILEGAREIARAAGRKGEEAGLGRLADDVRAGTRGGEVLRDSDGRPWGLAISSGLGAVGRRVGPVVLAADRQNLPGWNGFLTALTERADPAGPVVLLDAPTQGISEEEARSLLAPLGFRAFHRYGLMFPPGAPLPAAPTRPLEGGRLRSIGESDTEELAQLQATCYANSIDRFLFATDSDPVKGARGLLRDLFSGKYGEFQVQGSIGLEIEGRLRGVTVVTRQPDYLLLADVEVHPAFQGQGHARRLIRATLEALPGGPSLPLALAVTEETPTAYRLYQNLGFVVREGPFTFWARTEALGLTDPKPGRTAP